MAFSTLNSFSSIIKNVNGLNNVFGPPTNLVWDTANTTDSSIAISFRPSYEATSYTPYIDGVQGSGSGTPSSYLISVPTSNTAYSITMVANKTGETSGQSSAINVKTRILAPTITYSSSTYSTIVFTATIIGTATTTYNINVSGSFTNNFTVDGSTITVTNLNENTSYPIYITVGNGTYTSPSSNTITNSTPLAPASTPTGLTFVSATENSITFRFTSTGTVSGYTPYVNGSVATGSGTSSSYTITGLTASTSYSITITATNAIGTSSQSSALTASTRAPAVHNVWTTLGGSPTYSGTNVNNLAIRVFAMLPDTVNNCIYVGGNFTIVYDSVNTTGLTVKNIAKWDIYNNIWRKLGSNGNDTFNGLTCTRVSALQLNSSSTLLYVGGQSVSTAFDASNTSGLVCNNIVIWDINNNVWRQLGGWNDAANGIPSIVLPTQNNFVERVNAFALDTSNNYLYVGGFFRGVVDPYHPFASYLQVSNIAIWDISNNLWRQLGNDTYNGCGIPYSSSVNNMLFNKSLSLLYVCGSFTYVGDATNSQSNFKGVAAWNTSTSTWSPLGSNTNNGVTITTSVGVFGLAIDNINNQLYVSGNVPTVFDDTNTSGLTVNGVTRFDISNNRWYQLGNNTRNGTVGFGVTYCFFDPNNIALYVCGAITSVKDSSNTNMPVSRIAKWEVSNNVWRQLGTNTQNGVSGNGALYIPFMDYSNNLLYVPGSFITVFDGSNTAGLIANGIGVWNI
jgi:hypothetical protein